MVLVCSIIKILFWRIDYDVSTLYAHPGTGLLQQRYVNYHIQTNLLEHLMPIKHLNMQMN